VFRPPGRNALPASYSFRTVATRSFAAGRLHLNGSIASYAVRAQPSLIITCPGKTAPGATCGGVTLPPLDGPCSIGSQSSIAPTLYCDAPATQVQSISQLVLPGQIQYHDHWLLGAGIDKAFPLASTLLVADVFAEKFEGIGRKTDVTAEIGARRQIRPQIVLVGALGRHFRGAGFSTFITLGATISRALAAVQTRLVMLRTTGVISRLARLGPVAIMAAAGSNGCALNGSGAAHAGSYYDQTYLSASHNWAFRNEFRGVDALFNAFDYGHAKLYETLWRDPHASRPVLDERQFQFITRDLLRHPPSVPLDEGAIAPGWEKLAPEVAAMFDWAHMLHRQLYDV